MNRLAAVAEAATRWADAMSDTDLPEQDAAAHQGEPDEPTSAVVVALPEITTNLPRGDNNADADPVHVTLRYYENPDDATLVAIIETLTHLGEACTPFTAEVSGRGRLGAQDAAVLILQSQELEDLHDLLGVLVPSGPDKFPGFVAHATMGYGDEIDPETLDPAELPPAVVFDRLALWNGTQRQEFTLTGTDDIPDPDDEQILTGMTLLPVEDDLMMVASGASIPTVDDVDDLPTAVAYAQENESARWYVEKRARALRADASLTWTVDEEEPDTEVESDDEVVDDLDAELHGPGGVQAAAAWYIRTCSTGTPPADDVYADMLAAATTLDMLGDPVVASAMAWNASIQ